MVISQVKLYINGVSGTGVLLAIPFSQLGSPTSLTNITIQEFSNNNSLIYIDDLGLF
jgi:hypothetical protein